MGSGGLSSMLDISRRALFAQIQAIRVTSSNIANVNTEGYSRRAAQFEALQPTTYSGQAVFGTGVEVRRVNRIVDTYINSELATRVNDRAREDVRNEILARAEAPFSLDSTAGKIGFELSEFFSALEDLSLNPSDIPLRGRVIEQGEALTQSIQSTYNIVASLQRETDDRMGVMIQDVNRIAAQIADLNSQLAASEASGQENLTLRDQRDLFIQDLSEMLSIDVVDNGDGTVLVTLENGFGLVTGTSAKELEFVANPDFAPGGGFPLGLDGQFLGHIVYDFDRSASGTSHVDLTSIVAAGGGEIAGLLSLRGTQATTDTSTFDANGDLVRIAARVEAIARDLLTRFNNSYRGTADEDSVTAGVQSNAGDLNGNSPDLLGLFTFIGAPSSGVLDADSSGTLELSELEASGLPNSYANLLTFAIDDPVDIAAAIDLDPADASTEFSPGDARNILNLLDERTQIQDYSTFGLSDFSAAVTIENAYSLTVSLTGSVKNKAANDFFIAKDRETQVRELQSSISGVSLDEEFAKLINFQRAFEAAARMIKVGDDLLAQIIGLLG